MYEPAKVITAEVFATIPPRFDRSGGASAEWAEVNLHGMKVSSFLEGPSFDRNGNLYVVDIPYGRIFRISPAGEWDQVAEYDGWPNGLKVHKDGMLYVADQKNGIVRIDPASGKVEPFVPHYILEGFKGCNDLIFTKSGDLYFTDQGQTGLQDPTGRVFCRRADGHLSKVLDCAPSPNGIALNPTEQILYVCVTRGNAVWRVPLLSGGNITKVGIYVQLSGGVGPDGIAVDQEGGIAVAHVGAGQVWVFGKRGDPLFRILSPTSGLYTTNLAFGGPENRHLYIVESQTGTILRAELPTPGLRLYSHQ